jgi:hypothetical protein
MSTTQIVRPEAKSATVSSPHPAVMASLESSPPTTPAEDVSVEFPIDITGPSTAPRAGQTVFERVPSAKVTKSRRVLLTTLLILANIVQVSEFITNSRQVLQNDTDKPLDVSKFCWYRWR